MREIAYFMLETRAGEALSSRLGSRALRWETPRLEHFLWRGYRVSLYLFPCRLEGTKRLHWWMERIGSALEEQGTTLWLAPELEAAWEDWQPPLPDAALTAEILRGQPFRENLVLLTDTEETTGQWSRGRENGIRNAGALLGGVYPGHLRPCDHGLPAPGGQNDGQYPLRQSPALNAPRSRMGHGLGQIKTAKIIIQKK